jgi:hypothetical protein
MSKKSRERRKAEAEGTPAASIEARRSRRNRRLIFVGLIGLSFPIFEFIAYRFRTITISIVNQTGQAVRSIKVTYAGGAFDSAELKPGASLNRVIRPDFSFTSSQFSTYPLSIRLSTEDGQIFGQTGRAGALDYSAQEIFTVALLPPEGRVQIQHTTRPGFPLGLIRDILERLGIK